MSEKLEEMLSNQGQQIYQIIMLVTAIIMMKKKRKHQKVNLMTTIMKMG
jgi:hypothetical protein